MILLPNVQLEICTIYPLYLGRLLNAQRALEVQVKKQKVVFFKSNIFAVQCGGKGITTLPNDTHCLMAFPLVLLV